VTQTETTFFESGGEKWLLIEPKDGRAPYVSHRTASGYSTHIEMTAFLNPAKTEPQHAALRELRDARELHDAHRS